MYIKLIFYNTFLINCIRDPSHVATRQHFLAAPLMEKYDHIRMVSHMITATDLKHQKWRH